MRNTHKPKRGLFGFIPSDQKPDKPENIIKLPGEMGKLLGNLQQMKLQIIVSGETHSGKSELGKQIANAFASKGYEIGWIDWEQGGLESRDTQESIDRNVDSENKNRFKVSGEVPRTIEAVKKLAETFPVIVLDSGTKLNQVTNSWIDTLREEHPNTVWIILMQQNEKGGTRGGSAAEFDAPVVLKTYRPNESSFSENYAYVYKNRGNATGLYYNISKKRIVTNPTVKK